MIGRCHNDRIDVLPRAKCSKIPICFTPLAKELFCKRLALVRVNLIGIGHGNELNFFARPLEVCHQVKPLATRTDQAKCQTVVCGRFGVFPKHRCWNDRRRNNRAGCL